MKHIAANPAVPIDLFEKESTSALVNLLKGARIQVVYSITESLLREEFKLMDTELELVIKSFNDALQYLEMNC